MTTTLYPNSELLFRTQTQNDQHDPTDLGQEPVDVAGLDLAKAVHPEDGLYVMGRVPGGIKDDDAVGPHKVDTQASRTCWDQEQTSPVDTIIIITIIPLKSAAWDFYNLLTAPPTVSNTYTQVARLQSCATHQALIMCNMSCIMWYRSATKFNRV